jgi:hypothetical protein
MRVREKGRQKSAGGGGVKKLKTWYLIGKNRWNRKTLGNSMGRILNQTSQQICGCPDIGPTFRGVGGG